MPRAPLPPEDDTSVDGDDPSDEVPSDLESTEVDLESDSEASEPEASRTELNEDPAPAPAPAPRKPPARGKDAFSEVVPPAPQGRALAGPRRPARVTSRPLAPPGVPARSQPAEVGAPARPPKADPGRPASLPMTAPPSEAPATKQPTGKKASPPRKIIPAGTSFLENDLPPLSPSVPPTIEILPPNPLEAPTADLETGEACPPTDTKVIAGRYLVERLLGEGGMGAVYRVFDRELKRSVALKVIHPHKRDPRRDARFLHEARAMAKLRHPNCVEIHDTGIDRNGAPYLVMEFVDGESLHDIAGRDELSPKRAALIIHQIAGALEFAHENGIIHRDVKPQNILVSRDGTAKLADFGIAKDERALTQLTQQGGMVGTLSYMPPEQTRGEPEARSDVYALGATFYEALTGRPPFVGPYTAVLDAVLNDDPVPPSVLNREVPRDLDVICLKCLAKEKSGRYQTAKALQEDLARFLADEPIAARVPSYVERALKWVRRHKKAVVASVSAAVAVGSVALGIQLSSIARARGEARESIARGTEAFAAGDFEAAETAFAAAAQLETPYAREAQEAVLRARAWKLAQEADKAFALYVSERSEIEKNAPAIEKLLDETATLPTPFAEDKDKQLLATLSRRSSELEASSERHRNAAELAMQNALAVHREKALAERLQAMEAKVYELATDVDPTTIEPLAEAVDELAKRFECESKLPRGTIAVSSSPAGGLVRIYRYELDPKLGVERPHAFDPRTGKEVGVAPPTPEDYYPLLERGNEAGTTPIPRISLPAGSYLVTIEKEGCLLARLPVVVRRKTDQKLEARLYPSNVLGKLTNDFAYVPAGEARFGTGLRKVAPCGDVFVMKREVTFADWEAFCQDTNEEQARVLPFFGDGGREIARNHPNAAVRGVGVQQAFAYARWFAAKNASELGEGWTVSLPRTEEFFRSVRGSLIRDFTWGNGYDVSFHTRSSTGDLAPVHDVYLSSQDRSVFGVADLAGSVCELTEQQDQAKRVGQFVGPSEVDGRLTTRLLLTTTGAFPDPSLGSVYVGFRLAIRK